MMASIASAADWVAPVLRGGRGLKRIRPHHQRKAHVVAPVLRGGRGLKQLRNLQEQIELKR